MQQRSNNDCGLKERHFDVIDGLLVELREQLKLQAALLAPERQPARQSLSLPASPMSAAESLTTA